jgi:hypothetical protein
VGLDNSSWLVFLSSFRFSPIIALLNFFVSNFFITGGFGQQPVKSRPIHNWNNMLNRQAWFVVDGKTNKIVNGPFETRKIATLYVEEHESLCRQCVMNGSEILKKYQIYIGVPNNGRSN